MNGIVILLHSSKTMRAHSVQSYSRPPVLIKNAEEISDYLKTLDSDQIARAMHVSAGLAQKTRELIQSWQRGTQNSLAIDSFVGDIYSGLQVQSFTKEDREYADNILWILSGLYGFIRPLDTISPYRLEMGYKFPESRFSNLYAYWGNTIANFMPDDTLVVNVSSVEYSKVVTDYIDQSRVITPSFLTVHPKTKQPTFMAVHAKIARGAFAHWLIRSKIQDPNRFKEFNEIGYTYDKALSMPNSPVFVCEKFGGIGMSVRLVKAGS